MTEKVDVDEYILNKGKDTFLGLIKRAKTYTQWKIDRVLDSITFKNIEEKKKYIYILRPDINSIRNPVDRNEYIRLLASRLNLPEIDVFREMNKKRIEEIPTIKDKEDRYIKAQKFLISTFFTKFNIARVLTYLEESLINFTEDYHILYEYIKNQIMCGVSKESIIQNLINEANDKSAISDIMFKAEEVDSYTEQNLYKFIDDNVKCLNLFWYKEEIRKLRENGKKSKERIRGTEGN